MSAAKHPMQPLELGSDGVVRFKKNGIVRYLLDLGLGAADLNKFWLAFHAGAFSIEDMEQFYQLIGYSVGGFEEISEFSRRKANHACRQAERMLKTTRQKGEK